jgi:hypothetical protein
VIEAAAATANGRSPSAVAAAWTQADFQKAIQTGGTPSGKKLDLFMPYQAYVNLTNDEVKALWPYVHSVPSRPAGTH